MALTARIVTRPVFQGPDVLDALSALARQPATELAALHTGRGDGFSVIAAEPVATVEVDSAGNPRWTTADDLAELRGQELPAGPLDAWRAALRAVLLDDTIPHTPLVGWLGFLSYDLGRWLEPVGRQARDDTFWPLLRWSLYDCYYVFDHATRRWTVATMEWSTARAETADRRLDRMESTLAAIAPATDDETTPAPHSRLLEALPRQTYEAAVERVRAFIAAGDIYQANLAQRWMFETDARPEVLYRRLFARTPAEFSAFFRFADALANRAVISASPELFLCRQDGQVVTKPIKGTRPRDLRDPARDAALRDELLASPKDAAELAMIVDLLRNDLGRISAYGTVRVIAPREIQPLPTVWHTLATVASRLRSDADVDWPAIAAAMCPGGSITGAPKIRAMQILDELEPHRRGLYCGNIGWIGPRDNGILNIAIRTILMQDHQAAVWAGGGVVADSTPPAEYEETRAKAHALFDALNVHP